MFKRPRLSTRNGLVNALPMLALLFIASACGGPSQSADETAPNIAEITTPDQPEAETGLSLPAVWSTRDLGAPLRSVGIAGELGSTIAATYEDGGLQLFDFEGERITEKADLNAAQVANGRYLLLSGTAVTVFPGIDQDGDLKAYIHGGEMAAPIAYDLDSGEDTAIAGLCSAAPAVESDGVLRLAFWTEIDPTKLISGRLVQVAEELVFLPDEPVTADRPIKSCELAGTGATVTAAPIRASTLLNRRGKTVSLLLDTSGGFTVTTADETNAPLVIRDGISVTMPVLPIDMAGTGDTRGGGYPGGVVVVAGEIPDGSHRLVFIDPSALTLSAFE